MRSRYALALLQAERLKVMMQLEDVQALMQKAQVSRDKTDKDRWAILHERSCELFGMVVSLDNAIGKLEEPKEETTHD